MIVSLWGFMGAGKSTVGKQLAGQLGWSFIDTDSRIEYQQQKTIPQIFTQDGEDKFRSLETELLESILLARGNHEHTESTVLITGGGLPVKEQNRALLKQLGKSVFIYVPFETIVERLQNSESRPLWNKEQLQLMKARYEYRLPIYQEADISIECEDHTVDEIVEMIRMKL